MPVTCRHVNAKWRIVDGSGAIETTEQGNPRDGGGHDSEDACMAQARAINASLHKSGRINKDGIYEVG
jgi:hypothetical protein